MQSVLIGAVVEAYCNCCPSGFWNAVLLREAANEAERLTPLRYRMKFGENLESLAEFQKKTAEFRCKFRKHWRKFWKIQMNFGGIWRHKTYQIFRFSAPGCALALQIENIVIFCNCWHQIFSQIFKCAFFEVFTRCVLRS